MSFIGLIVPFIKAGSFFPVLFKVFKKICIKFRTIRLCSCRVSNRHYTIIKCCYKFNGIFVPKGWTFGDEQG